MYSIEKKVVNDVASFFSRVFHHGNVSRSYANGVTENVTYRV